MISIILETLRTGQSRVTAREQCRTVCFFDGDAGSEIKLIELVLTRAAFAHQVGSKFNSKFIEMNDAAKAVGSHLLR